MSSPEYDKTAIAFSAAGYAPEFDVVNRQIVQINDTNSGSYSAGQVNFDLTSLASSNAFMDLAGAVISIPIRLTMTPTGGLFTASVINQYAASLKNCCSVASLHIR
jgi:hypothetical protein